MLTRVKREAGLCRSLSKRRRRLLFFAHGAKIPLSSIKGSPNVGSILLLLRLDKLQISLFSPSLLRRHRGGGWNWKKKGKRVNGGGSIQFSRTLPPSSSFAPLFLPLLEMRQSTEIHKYRLLYNIHHSVKHSLISKLFSTLIYKCKGV